MITFKPKTKEIEVEGEKLTIKKWTVAQRAEVVEWSKGKEDKLEPLMQKVLSLSIVGWKEEDWQAVREQDGQAWEAVTQECLQFNGLNPQAVEQAKKN